jgi:hypothetical protein
MSAARTLTDADVEAIADALERRLRPIRARRIPPVEAPNVSPEERATIRDATLRKLARGRRKR